MRLPVISAYLSVGVTISWISLLIALPANVFSFEQIYNAVSVDSRVEIQKNAAGRSTDHSHLISTREIE